MGTADPPTVRRAETLCAGPEQNGADRCTRLVAVRGRGLCRAHAEQQRGGHPLRPIQERLGPVPQQICPGPGRGKESQCVRDAAHASGYCDAHHRQLLRTGELRPITPFGLPDGLCVGPGQGPDEESCGRAVHNKTNQLCGGHYGQQNRGNPLKPLVLRRTVGEAQRCVYVGCVYLNAPYGEGLCMHHWRQKQDGKALVPLRGNRNRGSAVLDRDAEGRKQCYACEEWKAVEEFSFSSGSSDGLSHRCRRCHASAIKKTRYGLDPRDLDRLLVNQGGGCAICGTTSLTDGRQLSVDHDHRCCPGETSCGDCVRGLLCPDCNRALGLFKDHIPSLQNATAYLVLKGVEVTL